MGYSRTLLRGLFLIGSLAMAAAGLPETANKLLYMQNFFYLPFGIEFQEGTSPGQIIPIWPAANGNPARAVSPKELETLMKDWAIKRQTFQARSLLLKETVDIGKSARISPRIVSHHFALSRGIFDGLPIGEQSQINQALQGKPTEVVSAFKQLRFFSGLIAPDEQKKFNLFIISPSWCESSKEYRVLLETYTKDLSPQGFVLHSIVFEDPKEEIFDSVLMKDLFPNKTKYTHENVPRFIAMEWLNGVPTLFEEGDALKEAYDRFFKSHKGYDITSPRTIASPKSKAQP